MAALLCHWRFPNKNWFDIKTRQKRKLCQISSRNQVNIKKKLFYLTSKRADFQIDRVLLAWTFYCTKKWLQFYLTKSMFKEHNLSFQSCCHMRISTNWSTLRFLSVAKNLILFNVTILILVSKPTNRRGLSESTPYDHTWKHFHRENQSLLPKNA